MSWSPASEIYIWELINRSWERMSFEQRKLWEVIKISPEKWVQHPWGNDGNGFWVVAIIGSSVIWYNDIENGFNQCPYTTHGEIADYQCDENELEWCVQHILDQIRTGSARFGSSGPPQPGTFQE